MVETGHHQHPPAPAAAGYPPVPSMAVNRGPTWAPAEQLHHLQYCIHSNPAWHETVVLAFQQYIVMLGTTVLLANTLVPPMGGDPGDKARVIQTILFMSGINTLLQTLIGTRLPTVMGVSFAYVLPVLSIIRDYNNGQFDSEKLRFRHTMRTVQGLGIVVAVGISFIQFTDTNSMRNMYVVGVSLFLSLSIAQYFFSNTTRAGYGPVRTAGGWFNDILNTFFASAPLVAIILATILDNTLEADHAINERGIPWWKPFQHRKGDSRNEEFYSMPLRINEYMPTRFL
ncbi:PREDICTED: nucleobase-ascorbate transporter 3-like [Camelina sativa]|uniref:Nucleobase-ascorbate transporter 3-like n=1 Tax=Camelina sativa TaxID=90675 RepID=A0ABM0WQ01_CAMSA|nr:PREDICTED: nucleobase-ascorbate transporter 3-like [Camelina sativa]